VDLIKIDNKLKENPKPKIKRMKKCYQTVKMKKKQKKKNHNQKKDSFRTYLED
jgi:hypothetical protein